MLPLCSGGGLEKAAPARMLPGREENVFRSSAVLAPAVVDPHQGGKRSRGERAPRPLGGSFDVPPRRMVCAGVRAARARLDCGSFISPSLEHLILDHLCSHVVVCDPAPSRSRILSMRCGVLRSDVSWSWLPRFEFYFSAFGTALCFPGDSIRDFWRRMFFYAYGCDRKRTKKLPVPPYPFSRHPRLFVSVLFLFFLPLPLVFSDSFRGAHHESFSRVIFVLPFEMPTFVGAPR